MFRRLLPLVLIFATACSSAPEMSVEPGTTTPTTTTNPNGNTYAQVCIEQQKMDGPWNNSLDAQWINEKGNLISDEQSTVVEAGGVPTLIQGQDGRLVLAFQWFACDSEATFDKVAVAFSDDEGATWSDPEPIEIADFPEDMQRPFDPTLALLDDGRIRIYYTSNSGGDKPFGDETNIYSAISEDGVHYTYEEGVRFDVDGSPAYDSAVGYWDGLWHMITPNNLPEAGAGAHYGTSEDGLTFTMQNDLTFTSSESFNWTGNFDARDDGLYFFGTPAMARGNWYARLGDDGWNYSGLLRTHGGDPAVTCVSKDRCLMISVQMPSKIYIDQE